MSNRDAERIGKMVREMKGWPVTLKDVEEAMLELEQQGRIRRLDELCDGEPEFIVAKKLR